jgi:hypothetical protein
MILKFRQQHLGLDAVTTASSTTSSNLVNLTTNQTISGIKSFRMLLLMRYSW